MHQWPELQYTSETEVKAPKVPDILDTDVSTLEGVKEVQKKADKADIEIIEKSVKLHQQEKYKYAFCIKRYATDENRIGSVKNEQWEVILEDAARYYQALGKKLQTEKNYTPPKDVKEKVFYDIIFRLKQLGFDKNSEW
jgi:hypothetical protein